MKINSQACRKKWSKGKQIDRQEERQFGREVGRHAELGKQEVKEIGRQTETAATLIGRQAGRQRCLQGGRMFSSKTFREIGWQSYRKAGRDRDKQEER
jgi:hypothetical protein